MHNVIRYIDGVTYTA